MGVLAAVNLKQESSEQRVSVNVKRISTVSLPRISMISGGQAGMGKVYQKKLYSAIELPLGGHVSSFGA